MGREAEKQNDFGKKEQARLANWSFLLILITAIMTGGTAKNYVIGIAVFLGLMTIATLLKLAVAEIIEAIEKD